MQQRIIGEAIPARDIGAVASLSDAQLKDISISAVLYSSRSDMM
jgi:hypothetical protein